MRINLKEYPHSLRLIQQTKAKKKNTPKVTKIEPLQTLHKGSINVTLDVFI